MVASLDFKSASPELFSTSFTARSILPRRTDCLWRIESGIVRTTTWLEDGTKLVLGIWGAGSVIGRPLSQIEPYEIECVTQVKAVAVPFSNYPNLAEVLLAHVHQAETLLQIRHYKPVDMMLMRFLSWLGERFGQDVTQGRLLDLRFTHLDIAEAIGSTRVTVTRTLNQLEQQGIIECLPLKRIILHETDLWHYEI